METNSIFDGVYSKIIEAEAFTGTDYVLPVAAGMTSEGNVKVVDLDTAPNILIAGSINQGKTTALNVAVTSLLFSKNPSELKFVFIDPTMTAFPCYSNLALGYMAVLPDSTSGEAVIRKPELAEKILRSLCVEMETRYEIKKRLPYLVIAIDEYADLLKLPDASVSHSIYESIIKLACRGKNVGIHLMMTTSGLSVDVCNGVIKANFPVKFVFMTATRQDSYTLIDSSGAELLEGRGDMLCCSDAGMERVQCACVTYEEISKAVNSISCNMEHDVEKYSLPDPGDRVKIPVKVFDSDLAEIAKTVIKRKKISVSDIQRMGYGYVRSQRIMEQLEHLDIIESGIRSSEVRVRKLKDLEKILSHMDSAGDFR